MGGWKLKREKVEVACGGMSIEWNFIKIGSKLIRRGRHMHEHIDFRRQSFNIK
jgi:hypothetical protein